MSAATAATQYKDRNFGRTCEVKDKDGRHFIVREGAKNTRVVRDNFRSPPFLVPTADLLKIEEIEYEKASE